MYLCIYVKEETIAGRDKVMTIQIVIDSEGKFRLLKQVLTFSKCGKCLF